MPNRREPVSKRDGAALDDIWRRLSGLFTTSESRRVELLERLGLSRGDSRALISLANPRNRSIGSLADEWQCDASTATRIVDRLEARGLAERRAVGHDRRVRGVALTPRGVRVKSKLVAALDQPPSEFAALSMPAREALQNALRSLPDPRSPAVAQAPEPQPGLEIRPVLAGDEQQVMAAARLFRHEPLLDAIKRCLIEPSHHLLIAYQDGAPAGFIEGIEQTQPDRGTEMFVAGLRVDERWRGRGIARVLVERLAETAKRRRCYGMWALTDAVNARALAKYRGAGALSTPRQVMLSWDFTQRKG